MMMMEMKIVATTCMHLSQSYHHSPSSSSSSSQALASHSHRRRSSVFFWGTNLHRSRKEASNHRSSTRQRTILSRASIASLDTFSDDEFSKRVQEIVTRFHLSQEEESTTESESQSQFESESIRFDRSEISSDPMNTSERIPANIEHKVNRIELPHSIRIIKRKMQWREEEEEEDESAYCSVKKAFSSMVFIIRELHSFTLQMREKLLYEDLQVIILRVQKEMHASFVWLFQQVFSHTPTLMMYVMILLANYSVHSMSANAAIIASPAYEQQEKFSFDSSSVKKFSMISHSSSGNTASIGGNNGGKYRPVANGTEGDGESSGKCDRTEVPNGTSEIEADSTEEEYKQTEILYQMGLAHDPNNALLLANYAQFLYLVSRDYKRSEEYFMKACKVDPVDAEALNKYAIFLWKVKKDLWAAEENYQKAISAEPSNSYYSANYAHFLWNTGGDETCYLLNE
ncbi:uncharacterized protein LOC124923684 [Impatiens glandulifera]|uniref:uncharacterized protein LOC124923684 n=1 Tax=Impatiens glandulifera TaxID=253017 RepID=UPI001FB081CC|nr:uncharacterized protein LOC124923684 [Impatiens glandulifera]